MNLAKDFCDCIISWEVQENRKISSVVHCSYSPGKIEKTLAGDILGNINMKHISEVEVEFTPVLLTPFLHPELTKASYCDLKIFVSPKVGVKLDRLIIMSTAKMIEFFDRNGEMAFSGKGDKLTTKAERGKDDLSDRSFFISSGKSHSQKTSSRWFINEYVPSIDTFEVMVRFCDHLVPNQLLIKYIGVKVITHDWSVELGSMTTGATVVGTSGHIGSTGSICSNNVTLNCDKVMEAIQNVNNAVQILANEVGCAHKGSNPHLPTTSSLDATAFFKHRRPNSPMATATGSSSPNIWPGISTRRSSDISNLQLWLETRLATMELTVAKGLDQLSNHISQLEARINSQADYINETHTNGNNSVSDLSLAIKTELHGNQNESPNEQNSTCQ